MKDLICVKCTKKMGFGVFATRNIKKDEIIAEFRGPLITLKTLEGIPREVQDHLYNVGIGKYIVAKEPAVRTNHSCEPNAGIKKDIYLVAMRNIKKGEEVKFDYSMITNDGWTLKCACGTKSCRKLIGNYKDLPEAVKQRYKDYTPDWIKKIK